MLKKLGQILILIVGTFLILVIVTLIVSSLIYTPEYVRRVFAWRETDVNDYRHNFPSRSLAAAPNPFYFDVALDEERVTRKFENVLQIDDFDSFLENMQTQAFIVLQDDTILYEKYFNETERDTMLTSFSVAKSFVSALVGAAIDEGYITSVDDPIIRYLPELAERDPQFAKITIRHLLMMAAGFSYQDFRPTVFNSDDILTSYYPDQRKAALEFTEIADPPGEYFSYNKYYPQLLGLILERTTGRSVTDYMQEKIWDPLGMEYSGSWSLDSEDSGFEKMEAGLNARAIDFAKLGRLYLMNGNWDGEQILSNEWISDSTRVDLSVQNKDYYPDAFGQSIFETLGGYYKYMWYGYFRDGDDYDFAAEGDHGQFIYVSPQKNLIIIRNGVEYGDSWGTTKWIDTFYQFANDF